MSESSYVGAVCVVGGGAPGPHLPSTRWSLSLHSSFQPWAHGCSSTAQGCEGTLPESSALQALSMGQQLVCGDAAGHYPASLSCCLQGGLCPRRNQRAGQWLLRGLLCSAPLWGLMPSGSQKPSLGDVKEGGLSMGDKALGSLRRRWYYDHAT